MTTTPALDRAVDEVPGLNYHQALPVARAVVSAALHDPDGALVETTARAIADDETFAWGWVFEAQFDGQTTAETYRAAFRRRARAAHAALRAAILGGA